MSNIKSLAEARALKEEDSTLWTPRDCAEAFLRDIASGEIKPSRVCMIYEEPLEDGGARVTAYRANCPRDAETYMIAMYDFIQKRNNIR